MIISFYALCVNKFKHSALSCSIILLYKIHQSFFILRCNYFYKSLLNFSKIFFKCFIRNTYNTIFINRCYSSTHLMNNLKFLTVSSIIIAHINVPLIFFIISYTYLIFIHVIKIILYTCRFYKYNSAFNSNFLVL